MTQLLTAAEMRGLEQAAMAGGAVSGLELMERAGRGVVAAILDAWPARDAPAGGSTPGPPEYLGQDEGGRRAVVLCGPGNNGGDGFVVARLLAERGWAVSVVCAGLADRLPPDARANYLRWRALGPVASADDPGGLAGAGLVVDALFGIGLTRPVGGPGAALLAAVARGRAAGGLRVVSVDVPSGLCADSGRALGGVAVTADLTVTFHAAKRGQYLAEGPGHCGRLVVCDIGLGAAEAEGACRLWTGASGLEKAVGGHKFAHGHALVLGGPPGAGGAGRLAARGALRVGAGLVTLACPPEALAENAARLDAVMLRPLADGAALAALLADRRINALCLGPGMGTGRGDLVAAALAPGEGGARVLDADALTVLAGRPDLGAALHAGCVLTPHPGEFARLFPDIAARLAAPATRGPAYSKVDACREAAARAGCVVLLKGPDTVVAAPDGRCAVHAAVYDRAAPWLATAGAGDVLAGFITGLLARGFAPFEAACTGAWLHVESARSFGPGLIAEDLPEELPKVFRAMGL